MFSFNKPDESKKICTEVNIEIADQNANGFLTASEVKKIMQNKHMYPLNFRMTDIKPRQIEDLLCQSPFVKTAECYKTKDNKVFVSITQRLPIIRIKSEHGDDYYLDDKGGIMPNTNYTSDLIIATGNIRKTFARNYISPMANIIMDNDLWRNMIEQINVLPDGGIEIVPRIGNHIVFLGYMPQTKYAKKRNEKIEEFVRTKLTRLEKFYKYGLSQVGWNKYPYISLEFDNQIICKKGKETEQEASPSPAEPKPDAGSDSEAAGKQSDTNNSPEQVTHEGNKPKADEKRQEQKKEEKKDSKRSADDKRQSNRKPEDKKTAKKETAAKKSDGKNTKGRNADNKKTDNRKKNG